MMRKPSSSASASTSKTPCCSKVGIKRGPWTAEEDELLANYIKREGEGRWRTLPKRAGLLRCGKSCRLRWMNYLRPNVKRGRIAPDEEDLILRLHRLLGNRWSLIAGRIPGRTDNEIKNYWNTHLSKKLIRQGIDPRTHKPLNPNPNSSNICHDLPLFSNQNPNPKPSSYPSQYRETNINTNHKTIALDENFSITNQEHVQNHVAADDTNAIDNNWQNSGGGDVVMEIPSMNNEYCFVQNCINNNDDTFSSFLDSLINDSVLVSLQQQQLLDSNAPLVHDHPLASSSAQTFIINHGNINWEAEVMSTMVDASDDQQNALNNQHA